MASVDVLHVDVVDCECTDRCIEVISQPHIDVAHTLLVHAQLAPERQSLQELLDRYEQTGNCRFHGGLEGHQPREYHKQSEPTEVCRVEPLSVRPVLDAADETDPFPLREWEDVDWEDWPDLDMA